MNAKYRYTIKYILFRFVPTMVLLAILSAALIFLSGTNGNHSEEFSALLVCAASFAISLGYFIFNIIRFLLMINRQEKQYGITFEDNAPVVLSKWSLCVICSENWLFVPGRFAICRQAIKSASIAEANAQKGGVIYPVKIKTAFGKKLKIKFKSEADAKFIRKWARK